MTPVYAIKLYSFLIATLAVTNTYCQQTNLTEIKRRSFDSYPSIEQGHIYNRSETESESSEDVSVSDIGGNFERLLKSGEGVSKIISDHIQDLLVRNNVSRENFPNSKLLSELSHLEIGAAKIENYLCKRQILSAISGARSGQVWALKMYDASAKVPGGLLHGSHYQLGNYDECMSPPLYAGHASKIAPQYCLADVTLTASKQIAELTGLFQEGNVTLHWAVCIPSSCTPIDTIQFLQEVLSSTGFVIPGVNITFDIGDHMCQQAYKLDVDGLDIFFISAIAFFILIICVATIYHLIRLYRDDDSMTNKQTLIQRIIMSFSFVENIRKLGSKSSTELGLESLNGIKALSMMFIVSGHAITFLVTGPVLNSDFFHREKTKIQNAFLFNSPLLVDTFLLLSGFLMCRILLLELEKRKGRISFWPLYVFRYIRLTPAYLVMVMLYSTWLVDLNDGPLWDKTMYQERDRCRSSWWANILYVNNYVNTDQMCMFQSWYLSADTQLFFLAPLIVYPLWRWRRFGETLLALATLISVAVPIAVTYIHDLTPTLLITSTKSPDLSSHEYFQSTYIKTHMRASSYCIGLFCGYLLHRLQSDSSSTSGSVGITKQPTFCPWVVRIGWTIGVIAGVGSMFSITAFYQPEHEGGPIISALYAGLHRLAWCIGTGWLIIACATGHGGFMNKILSWQALAPLSRLTYCAYLMNGLIELYALATVRSGRYMSVYTVLSDCLSHLCLTFLGALVLCVMFESPIHGLQKILVDKYMKAPKKTQETTDEA